jgi:nucleotidyltransferase substrate binding protein (TIGR01987 family)
MTIITEPLEKALATLKEAWHEYQKDISNTFVRDSVTQRFEYTYELSHKTLRRFLAESESSRAEIMELMFNDLIRLANKRGLLLNNLETWDKYRKARNLISHNHYEFNAKEIMIIIPVFIEEVETELNVIKEKLCPNTMNTVKIYV